MKPSKYIKSIARTNIIKKKQRTRLSLIAISLSTAIIFTSMILFTNVYQFSKNTDYEAIGNYHYAAYLVGDEVQESNRFTMTIDSDTHYYGVYEDHIVNLRSLHTSLDDQSVLPFVMTQGALATQNNEIVISDQTNLQIGDTLTLQLGNLDYQENMNQLYHYGDMLDLSQLTNPVTMSFTVCGIYHQSDQFTELTNNVLPFYTFADTNLDGVYYVKDAQVHLANSYSFFLEKTGAKDTNTITNLDVVSNDSIKNYLQDTTTILIIFIIIAAIAIGMSMISVHNVVLISDKDRKKELGLLKSIGATPTEIKYLLQIELTVLGVCGAILGIIIGSVISYLVLNTFIERIFITFSLDMVLNPVIILISFMIGVALMYFSGMKAYRNYITSNPISDLKGFSYEYGAPEKSTTTRQKAFSWKMFIIYNGRMKKQTKNIYYSFIMFLSTTVLFISIFLSNMVYVNKYVAQGYDFDISNYHMNTGEGGGIWEVDSRVSYDIYQAQADGKINTHYLYAQRLMLDGSFWTPSVAYDGTLIESYKSVSNFALEQADNTANGVYVNIYQYPAAFDHQQINELAPYIIEGSTNNMTSNDVILIVNANDRLGKDLCSDFEVGMQVAYDESITNMKTIVAIAAIPNEAMADLHFNYGEYPRVLAFDMEALIADGKGKNMSEHIYIDLLNESSASAVQDEIETILTNNQDLDRYACDSIAITVATNRFATFIIEVLLYPLFAMLFIVSLMNINNVFVGNVHLKRNDISIMKSVGMTGSQLNMLFVFEYVEGYLNASVVVSIIFIIVSLLESKLKIASSFDFAANIFGTLLISLLLLGVLLVAPFVVISLRKIKTILPIENLKDID